MTKHVEGETTDCPDCQKIRDLEKAVLAEIEKSDIPTYQKAYALVMLAFTELLMEEGGAVKAKKALAGHMADLFRKVDASDLGQPVPLPHVH